MQIDVVYRIIHKNYQPLHYPPATTANRDYGSRNVHRRICSLRCQEERQREGQEIPLKTNEGVSIDTPSLHSITSSLHPSSCISTRREG